MYYLDGAATESCFHNTKIMTLFVTSWYLNTLSGTFPQRQPLDCLDTSRWNQMEKDHIGFFIVQMNISDKYTVNPKFISIFIFCYPFTAHVFY